MKKIFIISFLGLAAIVGATSCHKDCVCKYYRNDTLYDIKTWDDKHVTQEDCEGMNDSYSLSIPLDQITDVPVGDVELVDFEVVCNQD